ncbi:MAG: hypothetical protein ABI388_00070, partial [Bacteroidia bacterium]
MRLKSTWFIFSFFFFSPWAFSQNQIDSLLNNLKKNLSDTEKIKTYLLLSGKYKATNYKKSVDYGLTALKISEAGNYKKQTTNSCKVLGKFFFEKERYDSALLYLNKSLLFIDAETDVLNYINVQKRIGTIYFYTSSYNNALEAFYQCLKFAEKIKDTKEIGHALANIGNVYKEESKYDEALVYYKRSKKYMLDLKDSSKLAPVYIDIGNVYYEYAKEKTKGVIYYDSSMAMYKSAEFILHNYTDSSVLSMLYCNMANIYADRGQFAAAIEKLKNSILIREKTQNFTQIAVQYQDLASIYLETHEYDLTKKYLDLGLEAASENNAYQDLATIYKDYAVYYAATNNYKKAYESSQLNKQYADSFFNEEDVEKRKELEMNFSFEKEREKQKLEEDKKELVHAEEKKRSLIYLLISVCGIVIVLFIALIVYRNFKRTQKAHIIISKQKNEIEIQKHFVEEKNKEVMDSIHYAKRIQGAVFTSENYIKKYVNDFLILYKPKDIVSGDFYWALNLNNKFYLATADCTGHGVPGAFMSLLNISFLNEV